jgi:predicted nuclease of predicted toxin-antitoxin system
VFILTNTSRQLLRPGYAGGIDVTTTAEAGLLGANDLAHLAFGLAQGRVVVTHDDDFLVHHAQGVPHAGIAFCHQDKHTMGDLFRAVLILHGVLTENETRGRVEFL